MAATKPGLADLKRLHKAAQARRKQEEKVSASGRSDGAAATRPAADDALLFRRFVGAVQPLTYPARHVPPTSPAQPSERLAARRQWAQGGAGPFESGQSGSSPIAIAVTPERAVRNAESDVHRCSSEAGAFLRAGYGPDVLRRLRRNQWPIQATLDLHGCTVDDAYQRLQSFLGDCLDHGVRCVRVVHGVGYGSPNGAGVLGPQVRAWLANWAPVMAYVVCAPAEGGQGALRVLLRSRLPRGNGSPHTTV